MSRIRVMLFLLLLVCRAIGAQERTSALPKANTRDVAESRSASNAPQAKLPVRRVVLYKNGVGYFEHLGHIRDNQDVHVDFTSAQLNDVLKSLTVLDLSGGKITGVGYNSEAPLARRLSSLRLGLGENPAMFDFLAALRGARLEVRIASSATVSGRVLSVEQKSRVKDDASTEWTEIALVNDAGEVRTVAVTPATTMRLAERDLQAELGHYLSLIASSRDRDVRRMSISTSGAGERSLYVSYISEVPIWKTTYRIVLSSKPERKPLLQGWAIVDNTIGEDWNDVELSLVAGAPHSFIQQLSQPYYGRRPVVALPESVQLTPQTHAAALDTASPSIMAGSLLTPRIVGGVAGGAMGGVVGGVLGGVPGASPPPPPEETEIEQAEEKSEPSASGSPIGDLFEYKLKERVTLRKNQSALVPVLQSEIVADKVSLWNESFGTPRPLRALWLSNTSTLTLDGGSFSVIDSNAFAGEGLVEAIKPGERRLLSYAADLGLLVDTKQESTHERVTRVRIYRGTMTTMTEAHERKTYVVQNQDTTPRSLVIEHAARPDWKLADGSPHPEEKAPGLYRFRLTVGPKQTERLAVAEVKPLYTHYELTGITPDQIEWLLRQKSINGEIEKALRSIVDQKAAVAAFDSQLNAQQKANDQIFADQSRLRENMKALKGSSEERILLQRYTGQLEEQETQLEVQRKRMQELQTRRDNANGELQKMIRDLQLDVAL